MEFKRDQVREDLYNSSYHIKPIVHIKYELNDDDTFKTFTLKFGYKDKEWILEEVYKGNTNLTDYCTLTGIEEKFDKFYLAELKLVDLMKEVV
jgi:hypothetical protein